MKWHYQHIIIILINIVCLFSFCVEISAQTNDKDLIRLGNRYYNQKNYSKAETNYRKALEKSPSLEAYYNLANSLVLQGKDSVAIEYYNKALKEQTNKPEYKAYIYHNIGDIYYMTGRQHMKSNNPAAQSAFEMAVELYKNALRYNSNDNQTRYNLAMAQYLLKKNKNNNKNNNNNKDKDNKDKQDNKDKDKQNKDNKENQKENKNSNNKEEDKNKEQNQDKNTPNNKDKKEPSIDDLTMMRLLNSTQQSEKKVQQKIKVGEKGHRKSLEKDW